MLGILSTLMIGVPALAAFIGPDVSNWQHPSGASINWTLVKAAGHSFAFVKATEDTTYTNSYFAADWKAIQAAGMDRGAYHFAQPSSSPNSAVNQANHFISVVGQAQLATYRRHSTWSATEVSLPPTSSPGPRRSYRQSML
jgi:GH25 family lysozyme M1 (1,4-beta-N-acetylmuramidase)